MTDPQHIALRLNAGNEPGFPAKTWPALLHLLKIDGDEARAATIRLLRPGKSRVSLQDIATSQNVRLDVVVGLGCLYSLPTVHRSTNDLLRVLEHLKVTTVGGRETIILEAQSGPLGGKSGILLCQEVAAYAVNRVAMDVYAFSTPEQWGRNIDVRSVIRRLQSMGIAAGGDKKQLGRLTTGVIDALIKCGDPESVGSLSAGESSWALVSRRAAMSHTALSSRSDLRSHLAVFEELAAKLPLLPLYPSPSDKEAFATTGEVADTIAPAVPAGTAPDLHTAALLAPQQPVLAVPDADVVDAPAVGASIAADAHPLDWIASALAPVKPSKVPSASPVKEPQGSGAVPASASASIAMRSLVLSGGLESCLIAALMPVMAEASGGHEYAKTDVYFRERDCTVVIDYRCIFSARPAKETVSETSVASLVAAAAAAATDGRAYDTQGLGCRGRLVVEKALGYSTPVLVRYFPCDKHGVDAASYARNCNCLALHPVVEAHLSTLSEFSPGDAKNTATMLTSTDAYNTEMLKVDKLNAKMLLHSMAPSVKYTAAKGRGYMLFSDLFGSDGIGTRGRKNLLERADDDTGPGTTPQAGVSDSEALSADARHCSCKTLVADDDPDVSMVECANQLCAVGWYHLGCTTLKDLPEEDETWVCAACSNQGKTDTQVQSVVAEPTQHIEGINGAAAASYRIVDVREAQVPMVQLAGAEHENSQERKHRHPVSGLTQEEVTRYASMGQHALLSASGFSSRYSSFAPSLTSERLRAFQGTVSRHQRGNMRVDEHFLSAIDRYVEHGWAVKHIEVEATTPGRSRIRALRVFLQSPAMRAVVAEYPHVSDVSAIDATFTVGTLPIHTYAWVGHLPESGGDALPLAYMLTLAVPDGDDFTRTNNICWFLEQCVSHGLMIPQLMLVDKCAATFKALARVAHAQISSPAALEQRATVHATLQCGAEGSTEEDKQAARLLLGILREDASTSAASSHEPSRFPRCSDVLPASVVVSEMPLEQRAVHEMVLKQEVLSSFGPLSRALCAVLIEDFAAAEERRRQVLLADKSFAAFQDAHDHLFAHQAFWRRDSVVGMFLRRYCLITAALCYFHAKASMLKRAQAGGTGLAKDDRVLAINSFFEVVVRVAKTRTEALSLFSGYKMQWEGRADAAWFEYLFDNWLSETWCSLLLLSKRNRCARLFLITTNSVELLWKSVKGCWLRGHRVSDFAFALLVLVGAPGNTKSAKSNVFAKRWNIIEARLKGEQRRGEKAASFRLINAVLRLSRDVEVGDVAIVPAADGSNGIYSATSKVLVAQHPQPPAGTPSSAASRPLDFPTVPFYTSYSAVPASHDEEKKRAARIAETVARVKHVSTLADRRGTGAAAVRRAGHDVEDDDATPLCAVLRERAKDMNGVVAQYRGLRLQYAATGEKYIHPNAAELLVQINRARLVNGALREGVGRGFVGLSLTRQRAAESQAALQVPPVGAQADSGSGSGVGVAADSSAGSRAGPVLPPQLEEMWRINKDLHNVVRVAWEAPQRGDFGDSTPPAVAYVYAISVGVPACELDSLCEAYVRRGENVSRMDGGPVPWGLRLMLQQVEVLAAALVAVGHGHEILYVTYVGQENRGIDSITHFLRIWDHLIGRSSGRLHGGGSSGLDQLVRFTSRNIRDNGRVLTPVSSMMRRGGRDVPHVRSTWQRSLLAIMPLNKPLVDAMEALLGAAFHGFGGVVANESPTGESQRYLARGCHGEPSRSESDLDTLVKTLGPRNTKSMGIIEVQDALLASQLRLTQRWLETGVFRGADGSMISPALLRYGEHSLWQCISALAKIDEKVELPPFDVVPYANFCGRCRALKRFSDPCKHIVYCRGLILVSARNTSVQFELPWWSRDTPAYLNFTDFTKLVASLATQRHHDSDGDAAHATEADVCLTTAGVNAIGDVWVNHLSLLPRLLEAVAKSINDYRVLDDVDVALQQASSQLQRLKVASNTTARCAESTDASVLGAQLTASAVRYRDILRTALAPAHRALGDPVAARIQRGGRVGLLEKSATTAEEVEDRNSRLRDVPVPHVARVHHAGGTSTTVVTLEQALGDVNHEAHLRVGRGATQDGIAGSLILLSDSPIVVLSPPEPTRQQSRTIDLVNDSTGSHAIDLENDTRTLLPTPESYTSGINETTSERRVASPTLFALALLSPTSDVVGAYHAGVDDSTQPSSGVIVDGGVVACGTKHSHSRTPGEERAIRRRH